jgi:hypothetical protein
VRFRVIVAVLALIAALLTLNEWAQGQRARSAVSGGAGSGLATGAYPAAVRPSTPGQTGGAYPPPAPLFEAPKPAGYPAGGQ